MAQAVDYSFSRPNPADLAAAGYVGAVRYLAPLPNLKVITGDELASLHANGLAVGFVWETGAQRAAKSGYAGGEQDAKRAIAMLLSLGAPAGTGIYYVLEDPTRIPRSQWPAALAYAQAVLDVGGPFRQGGYGSQALLEEAHGRGLILLGWQVGGWSSGRSAVCQLLQRSDAAANPPPNCDVNDILQDDWGQWAVDGSQLGDDMVDAAEVQKIVDEAANNIVATLAGRLDNMSAALDNLQNRPAGGTPKTVHVKGGTLELEVG